MLLQEQAAQGINSSQAISENRGQRHTGEQPRPGLQGKHSGGTAREWQRLTDLTPPTTEFGVLQWLHPKEIQACAHQCHRPQLRGAGRCSPEMRLAMVLVGTNRVLSTPSVFAAFSCSSEGGGGGEGQESAITRATVPWHSSVCTCYRV